MAKHRSDMHHNVHHTIVGPYVGKCCPNCMNLIDIDSEQFCGIRLVMFDNVEHHDIYAECEDWQTAYPQYVEHRCTAGCK